MMGNSNSDSILPEEDNLHPAEILRRKCQEERRQKTYAKVAALAKGTSSDSGISRLGFCVNVSRSQEMQAVILEVLCLDNSGRVLQAYTADCEYRATAVENTILLLLGDAQKENGIYELDEELALAVIPTISRLQVGFYRSDSDETLVSPLVLDETSPWLLAVQTSPIFMQNPLITPPALKGKAVPCRKPQCSGAPVQELGIQEPLSCPTSYPPAVGGVAGEDSAFARVNTSAPLTSQTDQQLNICFKAGDRILAAEDALLIVPGLVVMKSLIACLKVGDPSLFSELMRCNETTGEEQEGLLKYILEESEIPVIQNEAVSKFYEFEPRLIVWSAKYTYRGKEQLHAELYFKYGDIAVHESDERHRLYDRNDKSTISRDQNGEVSCKALLAKLGFRWSDGIKEQLGWKLAPSRLPNVVPGLLQKGWFVCADGKNYQPPQDYEVTITSGNDWFGISASVTYGNESVPFPDILKMWRDGKEYILLDDGTFGILPVEWLVNYTVLSQLGRDEDGQIICSASQAAILQALLDENATVHADADYYAKLERLTQIDHARSQSAPEGFQGTLRPYQEESLGWMLFLQQQGFGGILALDMGLGKTPTVLALLEGRRTKIKRPSLVVVPRSLIFNWEEEAETFTPELTIMVWSGAKRHDRFDELTDHDVILTTYGTLIRDAEKLQAIIFDYCILDESQAIKNADTSNAKAVRLVKADYRLAMTGTPIENTLSELWSQFEFLNPGLLGNAGVFRRFAARREVRAEHELQRVAQALRPFIFRRTKEAVAKDLPEKTEGILYCELESEQKQVYDDLLLYYHQEMAEADDTKANQAGMLSALLRLRQAACHAGLINDTHGHIVSAKLQAMMPHLKEILSEGHKALIFSQFTTMLGFVKEQLDRSEITYTYLDGQTRDRKSAVDQFQEDDACQVFLISLKAGGVGLNLTAASYVYILDPWWNPAIESQAIDRAYRIGQKKPVFAYRLIAKDTVEEKMLRMQREKRNLSDAVIGAEDIHESHLTRDTMAELLRCDAVEFSPHACKKS